MPVTESQRFPLLRIMAGNAFLLSAMYLVLGVLVEAGRRFLPANLFGRLAARLSLSLDALPMRVLDGLGLLEPIRIGYLEGDLPVYAIRVAFGVTTMALIFVLAVGTGMSLALLRKVATRRAE